MAEDLLLRSGKLSESSVDSAKWISELHFCLRLCLCSLLTSGSHLPEKAGYERGRLENQSDF